MRNWIKNEQRAGRLSPVQAKQCRDYIHKPMNLDGFTEQSAELQELDSKIRQAAAICW